MIEFLRVAADAVFAGLSYRFRGHEKVWPHTSFKQRVVWWASPIFLITLLNTFNPLFAASMGLAAFLTMLLAHSCFQDAGTWIRPTQTYSDSEWHTEWLWNLGWRYRREDPEWWKLLTDFVHGGFTGLLRGLIFLAPMWYFVGAVAAWQFVLAMTLLTPLAYIIARFLPDPPIEGAKGVIEKGEILTGLAVGTALSVLI